MGFFEAAMLAWAIGFGLYLGLQELGKQIRTGLVDAAKVANDKPVVE